MLSTLFQGDALLQAIADDQARISRSVNNSGPSVTRIQTALLSWDPGSLPQFGADGDYGDETAAAVHRFKVDELHVPEAEVIDDVGPQTIVRLDQIQAAHEAPPPPPATFVRRDVWGLQPGPAWHPIVLAYARAVAVMQARPASDPTSWAFQAAIHGSYAAPPAGAPWNQCQHRSWFFLPWHRMYLFFFERIVRSIVISQGGPADFALPYWNYDQGAPFNTMPLPFRAPTLPDGSPNPLHVAAPGRDPAWDLGAALPAVATSSAAAMAMPNFAAPPAPGFGGGQSPPAHFGGSTGGLEQTPHNVIHPLIGGAMVGQCGGGLMTDPNCAALDPIFWLHHANIDRLWNRWLAPPIGRPNPSEAAWLTQQFPFVDENGTPVQLAPGDVVDSAGQLGYAYDDLPAFVVPPMSPSPMPPQPPELGGATEQPMQLVGDTAAISLTVPQDLVGMVQGVVAGARRVFLNVEDIEADQDSGMAYAVYLNLPADAGADRERHHVGNFTLFGLGAMNDPETPHDGAPGLGHTFDVTDVVATLASLDLWDASAITVTLRAAPPGDAGGCRGSGPSAAGTDPDRSRQPLRRLTG